MPHHRVRIAAILVAVLNLMVAFLVANVDEVLTEEGLDPLGNVRWLLVGVAVASTATLGIVLLSAFFSFLQDRPNPFLEDEEPLPSWADLGLVLVLGASGALVWIVAR